jgi:hypothetical protein
MSHLSQIKLGLKSKELVILCLQTFGLIAEEVKNRNTLRVKGTQFGVRGHNIDFVWLDQSAEYEISVDLWALTRTQSTLPRNFINEFKLEYTKQMVQAQAKQLGLNMGDWTSDDQGSLRVVIGSTAGQISVEVGLNGLKVGVQGVLGANCQQFSKQLENALGQVQETQLTAEYYAGEQAIAQQQIMAGW